MPPTLQQVREKWKPVTGNGQPAEAVHASAIPAALVTNVPEWDSYLRHLQAKLEEAQAAADQWREAARSMFVLNSKAAVAIDAALSRANHTRKEA